MRRTCLAALLILIAIAARPAAGQVVWTEIVRSPMKTGFFVGDWRWVRTGHDAYHGCISAASCAYDPYEPANGPYVEWWSVDYDDSAWSRRGYAAWDKSWGGSSWLPIAQIGPRAWRAAEEERNGKTDLHRRWFTLPIGYEPLAARIWVFSDNDSRWFVNGVLVIPEHEGGATRYRLPADLLHEGANLLAVSVSNDNICWDCNPMGIQYLLEAQFVPTGPPLALDPPCAGGGERTVSWPVQPGLEVRVQAARDAGFSQDVRTSPWSTEDHYTFVGLMDGLWYYRSRARDGLSTGSWSGPSAAVQDATPPTTTAALSGTMGGADWYVSPFVVASLASVETGCGLWTTTVQIDDGPWQLYDGPFSVSGDGRHLLGYYSEDVVGNREMTRSLEVGIDSLPPVTTAAPSGLSGDGGWWRSPVRLDLLAHDETSGVAGTGAQVDGGAWVASPTITVTGEGAHTVACRSVDVAGNEEISRTLRLYIDTVPPSTTPVLTATLGRGGWYTDVATVTLTAYDATSGVRDTLLAGTPFTTPLDIRTDGRHSLAYRSVDVAGNEEPTQSLSLGLDTTPPLGAVQGGSFCPACGQRLAVYLSAADATSGVAGWRLEVLDGVRPLRQWSGSGVPPQVVNWEGKDGSGRRVRSGFYALRLWVEDVAGWVTTAFGRVEVAGAPPPALVPIPSPTAISSVTPVPSPTPRPSATPLFLPPSPVAPPPVTTVASPTSVPVAAPVPEAEASILLRGVLFQDDDADAVRSAAERGLAGLRVRVQAETAWWRDLRADPSGWITATLPGPGGYVLYLVDRPGPDWQPTTRTLLSLQIGRNRAMTVGATDRSLPLGAAEGMDFAIGLRPRLVRVWLSLAGSGLLFLVALTAVLDLDLCPDCGGDRVVDPAGGEG